MKPLLAFLVKRFFSIIVTLFLSFMIMFVSFYFFKLNLLESNVFLDILKYFDSIESSLDIKNDDQQEHYKYTNVKYKSFFGAFYLVFIIFIICFFFGNFGGQLILMMLMQSFIKRYFRTSTPDAEEEAPDV